MRITLICAKTAACYTRYAQPSRYPVQAHRLSQPLAAGPPGAALRRLPPLGSARADLAPTQHRALVMAIVALHLLAAWALLQVQAVRDSAVQVMPILVDLLASPAPPTPPAPPRPSEPVRQQPPAKQPPPPKPRTLPPPQPALPSTPSPAAPTEFTAPQPDSAAAAPPLGPAPAAAAEPAPPAVAAPPPKLLPDAAVQYLEPPRVEYPRLSQKRGETGLVLVRAYIGSGGGAPHSAQVEQSSGHARLDQAAVAAVHKARFKPYAEAGRPVQGWALIPIRFELEK